MTLRTYLDLHCDGGVIWNAPPGPIGTDFTEIVVGLAAPGRLHPPSLRNPIPVPVPVAQDGWHRNDSPEAKRLAREDLGVIMDRLRRQIGKPEVAQTAAFPLFPNIAQIF